MLPPLVGDRPAATVTVAARLALNINSPESPVLEVPVFIFIPPEFAPPLEPMNKLPDCAPTLPPDMIFTDPD